MPVAPSALPVPRGGDWGSRQSPPSFGSQALCPVPCLEIRVSVKGSPVLKGLSTGLRKQDTRLGTRSQQSEMESISAPGPRGQSRSWGAQWMTTLLRDREEKLGFSWSQETLE